jgi:transposase
VAAFLEAMITELDRDVLVILDNWEPHRLAIEYLEETNPATASRLAVAYFPTYAPDLNPPEQLWTHVKYGQLANYVPTTIEQLHRRAEQLIAEKQSQQETLRNYIRTAKLEI